MAHIEACQAFIAGGGRKALIIFPEGTRIRTGEMQHFKRGPAVVSTTLGLPLVPAYIDGTVSRPGARTTGSCRPRHIRVRFGPPVPTGGATRARRPSPPIAASPKSWNVESTSLRERTRYGERVRPT